MTSTDNCQPMIEQNGCADTATGLVTNLPLILMIEEISGNLPKNKRGEFSDAVNVERQRETLLALIENVPNRDT